MRQLKKTVKKSFLIIFLTIMSSIAFADKNDLHCLSPLSQNIDSIDIAIKQFNDWQKKIKKEIANKFNQRYNLSSKFVRSYKLFIENKLSQLTPFQRIPYAEAIFSDAHPIIKESIEDLKTWMINNPDFFSDGYLTPEGYYELDKLYHKKNIEKNIIKKNNSALLSSLVFIIDRLIFDFKQGEKEILEILWLDTQLQKELSEKGSGIIPSIATISDLHGGAKRSIPMVAHILGLEDNNNITTVKELRKKLKEISFDPVENYIRIVAMSDIPDRGNYPAECHRLVEFLVDELHIGRFIIGNHDLWRLMGVLGIHKLNLFKDFFDKGKFIGPADHKANHPAYWSNEAIVHSGWSSVEVDEMNQERLNMIIEKINDSYSLIGDDRLENIDIIKYRTSMDHEVKEIKEYNNIMRQQGKHDKIKDVPSLADATNRYLIKYINNLNNKILDINQNLGYEIDLINMKILTVENYHLDPEVLRRVYWDLKHFRLFYIDPYGNLHLHSIPPIKTIKNARGEEIKKIDVSFAHREGLLGMEAMQNKVQNFFTQLTPGEFVKLMQDPDESQAFRETMWEELGDIFTTVDSWYSDVKATAKLKAVQHFIDIGAHDAVEGFTKTSDSFTQRSARLGSGIIIGHNDRKKLKQDKQDWIEYFDGEKGYLINTDGSMSEGYDFLGRITVQGRMPDGAVKGISNYGFSDKNSTIVEDISDSHFYSDKIENYQRMQFFQNTSNWINHQLRVHGSHLAPKILQVLGTIKKQNNHGKYKHYMRLISKFDYLAADNIIKMETEKLKISA